MDFWRSVGVDPTTMNEGHEPSIRLSVQRRTKDILRRAKINGSMRRVGVTETEWKILWSDNSFATGVKSPEPYHGSNASGVFGDIVIVMKDGGA